MVKSKISPFLANAILVLAAPCLVFMVCEGLFALFQVQPLALTEDPYMGFSSLQPLFVDSVAADGRAFYVTNPVKLTHFNPQRFPKEKGPRTRRIFTLGGSTTYGHPFHDPTSYSGWLRAFLAKADPSHDYEVINAGGISYASYREAELMNELSAYAPDAFIVYSGHNEFLEERTYRQLTHLPKWLRTTSAALDRTRTYSALRRLIRRITHQKTKPGATQMAGEVDDVLAKTIGPTSYVRDDALKAGIVEHFNYSLNRMGRIAKACGARIFYVTTPVNEKDCAPFKSEPTPGLGPGELNEVAMLHRGAEIFLGQGHPDSAYGALAEALRRDPRNAQLQFEAGQAAWSATKWAEAKIHFRSAIEEDICPLRALRAMDTAMRRAAQENEGFLVDYVDTLENASNAAGGHGNLGAPLFLDHVHLDLEGYRRLGLGLLQSLKASGLASEANLSEQALAQVTDSLNGLMTPLERGLALTNLAKVINWAGKHDEAAHLAEQALQLDSTSLETIWSSLFVGALRERQGRGLESLPHYRRAVRLDPSNAESRMYLGGALLRLDSLVAARAELDTARHLAPEDPDIAEQWAKLELKQGNTQAALAAASQPHSAAPSASLESVKAEALLTAKRFPEAKLAFEEVLKLHPQDARAYEALGQIAMATGATPEAIQYFARAMQLDPNRTEAKMGLTRLLQGMGTSP